MSASKVTLREIARESPGPVLKLRTPPAPFYGHLGFTFTGAVDHGEHVMSLAP